MTIVVLMGRTWLYIRTLICLIEGITIMAQKAYEREWSCKMKTGCVS